MASRIFGPVNPSIFTNFQSPPSIVANFVNIKQQVHIDIENRDFSYLYIRQEPILNIDERFLDSFILEIEQKNYKIHLNTFKLFLKTAAYFGYTEILLKLLNFSQEQQLDDFLILALNFALINNKKSTIESLIETFRIDIDTFPLSAEKKSMIKELLNLKMHSRSHADDLYTVLLYSPRFAQTQSPFAPIAFSPLLSSLPPPPEVRIDVRRVGLPPGISETSFAFEKKSEKTNSSSKKSFSSYLCYSAMIVATFATALILKYSEPYLEKFLTQNLSL
ncbi:MAG: hypothetical protein KR126chlam6_00154 [Candidatus Anoxychlamydiales bacterium]|nr:hypothetical protein [Candidatus Anoxychlamydiales bacterium]